MITLKELRVGSVVSVRGSFGKDDPKTVTVTEVHNDLVNGYSFITYTNKTEDTEHWAYLDQVDRVINY